MTRTLIAYYSLTGYTQTLARQVAERCDGGRGADLLEIVPAKPYSYFSAGVKGVTQAMTGAIVELSSPVPLAGGFGVLVVLSPTWGWMSSPPVRSFVAQLPRVEGLPAVVGVTHAGGPIGSFDRLAALVRDRGYRVVTVLSVFCYDAGAIARAAEEAARAIAGAVGVDGQAIADTDRSEQSRSVR